MPADTSFWDHAPRIVTTALRSVAEPAMPDGVDEPGYLDGLFHIKERQAAEEPAAPDLPARSSSPILPVEYFADLQPDTETRDFVEGLLIEEAMSVIYGESNAGKTFFATDLAFHIAAGWAWNGREVDRGAVLYCALEGGHGIRRRLAAIEHHYPIDKAEIPFAIVPIAMNLLDPDGDVSAVIETIRHVADHLQMPIRAVFMDTLSRAMAGGNENSPEDMGALVTNGTRIQQATKAHVCWIHHSGKDQAKGARGHSLLRAATDTEIEVIAEGGSRVARVTKQREMECSGEFAFTLKVIELGTNRRGKPITSCVVDHGEDAAGVRRHTPGGVSALRSLTGHTKRALEVLTDLVAASGEAGYSGTPAGTISVPDKWWRERFYDRSMPGDSDDAKQKAFRRAGVELVNRHLVGMAGRRVWLVYQREHADNPA